ncbi:MAG: TPM domain-containing protein [Candidatus Woesearchaeota archaeon]|nr:TPM domain-containing protein [Candidatus Woesearchaeota archaeon]
MKKLVLIFLLLLPLVHSQQIEYFINDYSGLLTDEQIAEIEPVLKEIYDSKKAEYAVVIVDTLDGEDIEGYAYKLAEGNLGDKEKNNGLLLLIALDDRQYRFEVGRGLEPELPDMVVSRIGRYYIEPSFKEGNYAKGIYDASDVIRQILLNGTSPQELENDKGAESRAWMIFIIVIIVAILIFSLASKNTRPVKGRKDDDYFTAAWILSQMLKGGKGGSGGFSGGGSFGGFGGGSFGGGGAGGRWNKW